VLSWPRAALFAGYRIGWFAPAVVMLAFAFVIGLFAEGATQPLAFLPLFNPLELSLVAILALLYGLCEGQVSMLRRSWPFVGFALLIFQGLSEIIKRIAALEHVVDIEFKYEKPLQ